MSSTLEQDYDGFNYSTENQHEEAEVDKKIHNLNNNLPKQFEEVRICEICDQKFQTKKDLQNHLIIHLGKPRVVLERISHLKTVRKESKSEEYWLETNQTGNLKIKLKRQSPSADSLKLTLKKSPLSEGFTVVSNNIDSSYNQFPKENELAGIEENESKSDSEEEEMADQSFENVMLNHEVNNEDDNFESESEYNPLGSLERPLMDNNEQDSGVGSDSINPLEKDDQNVDDLQADNISNSDQTEINETYDNENNSEQNEDPEEAELVATCRETIENLKQLEEQSNRFISSRSPVLLDSPVLITEQNDDSTFEENVEGDQVQDQDQDQDQEQDQLQVQEQEQEIDQYQNQNQDQHQDQDQVQVQEQEQEQDKDQEQEQVQEEEQEQDKIQEQSHDSDHDHDHDHDQDQDQDQEQDQEQENNLDKQLEHELEETQKEREEEEEEEEEAENLALNTIEGLKKNSEISLVPKSALMPPKRKSHELETEILPLRGLGPAISWNRITENKIVSSKDDNNTIEKDNTESERAGSILQNFLMEQQRDQSELHSAPILENEYVSLEKIAETVNTCKVCNEKFKDITQLDNHRVIAGHFQCNIPDCSSLIFITPTELSMHKVQVHGARSSPSLNNMSPHHLPHNSPQSHHSNSPLLNRTSPHLNPHSPLSPSLSHPRGSPMTSPHTNSPTYQPSPPSYPGINIDQLPHPVQQLAQQVQRMPLPQTQLPHGMPPSSSSMIPGPSYYPTGPGRPPMYRVQAPIHYPPHLTHMYQQYGQNPYPHLGMPGLQQQMGMGQQIPRGRYPVMMPGQRSRMPQQMPHQGSQAQAPVPPLQRVRLKRPSLPQPGPQNTIPKRVRMEMPNINDPNDDADCQFIAQQKRNDGLPVIQNVQGSAPSGQTSRSDSTIHLTDSITLSVRQPAQVNAMVQNTKKPDATAVASVLAARGITVTPASNKKPISETIQAQPQQQSPVPKQLSTLNLNSAISIIPAASQRKQQEQQQQGGPFAIPQNKNKQTTEVERPPRPPTVDLTQELPSLPAPRRGRPPRMLQSLTCQICDKRFQSQEILAQHMASHRTTNKLLHKCNLCPAQYPSGTALMNHKKTYHKEMDSPIQPNGNIELALPVVDLKSPITISRLSSLGIQSFIPLSQLSLQTGGYFGLPIVTMDSLRNPNMSNLAALGASSVLSLGPLKHLPNR